MDPKITDKALEIVDQLTEGLKAVAPQMANLTLTAVKFDAFCYLGYAIVSLVVSVVVSFLVVKGIKFLHRIGSEIKRGDSGYHDNPFIAIGQGAMGLGLLISWGITFSWFNSNYMWAALFDPRVAIALRLMDKLLTVTNTK